MEYIGIFLVVMNSVLLALDQYPENPNQNAIDNLNFVLVLMFVVELLAKIALTGYWEMFQSPLSFVDSGIVLISIIQVFLTPPPMIGWTSTSQSQSSGVLTYRSVFVCLFV